MAAPTRRDTVPQSPPPRSDGNNAVTRANRLDPRADLGYGGRRCHGPRWPTRDGGTDTEEDLR
ncbi:MAG: hypothetical protein AMXMBFR64_22860 [Myxococcales bacterium]